jgi:hypothetical protein
LMRQQQNYFWVTISKIAGWETNTKIIQTETLLHLNLEIFLLFLFLLIFYFIFSQSSVSLMPVQLCWLLYYLSLFISLKLVCFDFFVCSLLLPFPSPLTLPF